MVNKSVGFLQLILGDLEGYLALGYRNHRTGAFTELTFRWPEDHAGAEEFINQRRQSGNLYFCPTLLTRAKRKKDNISTSKVVWADLDECHPSKLLIEPSVVVQTSRNRWQAFWLLDETYHALDVEAVNKRIAYTHEADGCDLSGWDLTQYLRIPGTTNFKYVPQLHAVEVAGGNAALTYPLSAFDDYGGDAAPKETRSRPSVPFPEPAELAQINAADVINNASTSITGRAWSYLTLVGDEPDEGSWSEDAWALQLALFNAGLSREEVFVVVWEAPVNKWKRDHGDTQHARDLLWKDVLRAEDRAKQAITHHVEDETEEAFYVPNLPLLTDQERKIASQRETIVEEYIKWARTIGDAAVQYHEAGAFIILSALLCGSVRLLTSYGSVVPNLWFMILADTTLTRKTTAMDLAMDLIAEIDSDVILATDGSIEGLMTSLSMRPGRPSVFLRDEFSGLLELVNKRDYYAGMLEALTKLYDGKLQKRVLRKETILVKDPRLILFAGGIKDRIYSLISQEHINSGFIPRFCFITAESDPLSRKPLGPPTDDTLQGRDYLLQRFRDIYTHYNHTPPVREDQDSVDTNGESDEVLDFGRVARNVELTDGAWVRYNKLEDVLTETGLGSSVDHMLTPMMARLCQSGLKVAILLAAAEALVEGPVVVQEWHIVQAFYYVERWKQHALNVVANAGKTATEKELQRVYDYVCEYPGVSRGKIMQRHQLTARTADNVFATLTQRMLIRCDKGKNRGEKYYPVRTTKTAKLDPERTQNV